MCFSPSAHDFIYVLPKDILVPLKSLRGKNQGVSRWEKMQFEPGTTQGLGALTPLTVESPHIILDS